jgi:hypothetical protein
VSIAVALGLRVAVEVAVGAAVGVSVKTSVGNGTVGDTAGTVAVGMLVKRSLMRVLNWGLVGVGLGATAPPQPASMMATISTTGTRPFFIVNPPLSRKL